jgi:hypothetical protein
VSSVGERGNGAALRRRHGHKVRQGLDAESCPQQQPHSSVGRARGRDVPAGPTVGRTMSIEWLAAIDQGSVSEVQLADGWHTIDVPSFTVSPQDASFSFDETVAHTHTSPRTRVVVGPLSAVLAVAFAN